jgi:hypothetical protein
MGCQASVAAAQRKSATSQWAGVTRFSQLRVPLTDPEPVRVGDTRLFIGSADVRALPYTRTAVSSLG